MLIVIILQIFYSTILLYDPPYIIIHTDEQIVRFDCTGAIKFVIKTKEQLSDVYELGNHIHYLDSDVYIDGYIVKVQGVDLKKEYLCEGIDKNIVFELIKVTINQIESNGIKLPNKGRVFINGDYCQLTNNLNCHDIPYDDEYLTVFNKLTRNNKVLHEFMKDGEFVIQQYIFNQEYLQIYHENTIAIPKCNQLTIVDTQSRTCKIGVDVKTCNKIGVKVFSHTLEFRYEKLYDIYCEMDYYTLIDTYLFKCPIGSFLNKNIWKCENNPSNKYYRFVVYENSLIYLKHNLCKILKVENKFCSLEINNCPELFISKLEEETGWYRLTPNKAYLKLDCSSTDITESSTIVISKIDTILFRFYSTKADHHVVQYEYDSIRILLIQYRSKTEMPILYGSQLDIKNNHCSYYKDHFDAVTTMTERMDDVLIDCKDYWLQIKLKESMHNYEYLKYPYWHHIELDGSIVCYEVSPIFCHQNNIKHNGVYPRLTIHGYYKIIFYIRDITWSYVISLPIIKLKFQIDKSSIIPIHFNNNVGFNIPATIDLISMFRILDTSALYLETSDHFILNKGVSLFIANYLLNRNKIFMLKFNYDHKFYKLSNEIINEIVVKYGYSYLSFYCSDYLNVHINGSHHSVPKKLNIKNYDIQLSESLITIMITQRSEFIPLNVTCFNNQNDYIVFHIKRCYYKLFDDVLYDLRYLIVNKPSLSQTLVEYNTKFIPCKDYYCHSMLSLVKIGTYIIHFIDMFYRITQVMNIFISEPNSNFCETVTKTFSFVKYKYCPNFESIHKSKDDYYIIQFDYNQALYVVDIINARIDQITNFNSPFMSIYEFKLIHNELHIKLRSNLNNNHLIIVKQDMKTTIYYLVPSTIITLNISSYSLLYMQNTKIIVDNQLIPCQSFMDDAFTINTSFGSTTIQIFDKFHDLLYLKQFKSFLPSFYRIQSNNYNYVVNNSVFHLKDICPTKIFQIYLNEMANYIYVDSDTNNIFFTVLKNHILFKINAFFKIKCLLIHEQLMITYFKTVSIDENSIARDLTYIKNYKDNSEDILMADNGDLSTDNDQDQNFYYNYNDDDYDKNLIDKESNLVSDKHFQMIYEDDVENLYAELISSVDTIENSIISTVTTVPIPSNDKKHQNQHSDKQTDKEHDDSINNKIIAIAISLILSFFALSCFYYLYIRKMNFPRPRSVIISL